MMIRNQLKTLPRRAIVAFALRCARRVEPLTTGFRSEQRDAIAKAFALGEAYCLGLRLTPDMVNGVAEAARSSFRIIIHADQPSKDPAADSAYDSVRAAYDAARSAFDACRADVDSRSAPAARALAYTIARAGDAAAYSAFAAHLAAHPNAGGNRGDGKSQSLDDANPADAQALGDLQFLKRWSVTKTNFWIFSVSRTNQDILDPRETGPMGSYWPHGTPAYLHRPQSQSEPAPARRDVPPIPQARSASE